MIDACLKIQPYTCIIGERGQSGQSLIPMVSKERGNDKKDLRRFDIDPMHHT
jgi:hypothetical protein